MRSDQASSPFRFGARAHLPIVLQTEATECGLACLAMVAAYHGQRTSLTALRARLSTSLRGVTLRGLIAMADQLGLAGRPLRLELEQLGKLQAPAVLHWDMSHFVVLKRVTAKHVEVHDPALGARRYTFADASRHFTGIALELRPTQRFERRDQTVRMRLSDFWHTSRGLPGALLQLLVLSIFLQLFALGSPFYLQLVVDEGLLKRDGDLISVLALGFLFLALLQAATHALRSWVVLYLSTTLSFQIAANMFRHLVRLPLAYFEKRHIGDVVSRFRSIDPIRELLTTGLVTAVIDGLMALATLVVIVAYSPLLTGVVLTFLAAYVALRVASYRALHALSEEEIVADAKESSSFMETVRAIQSIKSFGREQERQSHWQNLFADRVNASVRLGRLELTYDAARGLLMGCENVLVVYLAARAALRGELTAGMIFAFLSYKQQFIDRMASLVHSLIELRKVSVHLDRVADVAFTETERGIDGRSLEAAELRGEITLKGLGFKYSAEDPAVFSGVDLRIRAGESVVIVGPSGAGKSTLLKVVLGLLEPTEGELCIDGRPVRDLGLARYRSQTATVMQDDQLLSGTIAENIAFFDPECDMSWVVQCAQLAAIDHEIAAMPMGYSSLIGDMGTVLSAGQRQRVLLARALYRRPKILFLDEGTANLDLELERRIGGMLRSLSITRVAIAHRPEMIRGADRVLTLRDGALTEEVSQQEPVTAVDWTPPVGNDGDTLRVKAVEVTTRIGTMASGQVRALPFHRNGPT